MSLESGKPEQVNFPDGHDLAVAAIEGFGAFLTLYPDVESRRPFTFVSGTDDLSILPIADHDNAELGYFCRTGRKHADPKYDHLGGVYDRKEVFHFAPRLWTMLRERGVELPDALRPWLSMCHRLYYRALQVTYSFANLKDTRYPRYGMKELLKSGEAAPLGHCHVLRLLRYKPLQVLKPLGHGHTDRNALSLHVAESWPALCARESGQLWSAEPGTALVFAGDKAQTHWGLKPFGHTVYDSTDRSLHEERWAVVFFAHTAVPSP